jgi:hypothetical protein
MTFSLSRFQILFIALATVLLIGVLGFMFAEGLSLGDAIYFSIVTISTVGYGDVHPTTQVGKILATMLIIGGTGSFLGIVAAASEMLLDKREKQVRIQKIHMIMGAFFSDIGTELLTNLSDSDPNLDKIKEKLVVNSAWIDKEFFMLDKSLREFSYEVNIEKIDLTGLKSFFIEKKNFLLRLLENPFLLENESFSELLRSVFHLYDELMARRSFKNLPKSDLNHLAVDTKRVYSLLAVQWLHYMRYLKVSYPYLFHFAMRNNPFDENATPIIK